MKKVFLKRSEVKGLYLCFGEKVIQLTMLVQPIQPDLVFEPRIRRDKNERRSRVVCHSFERRL